MRLISWNTNHRAKLAVAQAEALVARQPDVVALQEVIATSVSNLARALKDGGLTHVLSSVAEDSPFRTGSRGLGVLLASRYPLRESTVVIHAPWKEKTLSVHVALPERDIELHTVHVPPGSTNGWIKVETLEAIHRSQLRASEPPSIYCGDFNAPQAEFPSGEIATWAQRIASDGRLLVRKSFRGGDGQTWDSAERRVLTSLRDAFRELHGYLVQESSFVQRRKHDAVGRRFDHVFVSDHFALLKCHYLHELRIQGLSDHSPVEVELEVLRAS